LRLRRTLFQKGLHRTLTLASLREQLSALTRTLLPGSATAKAAAWAAAHA
jgi:hypothetical protein